MSERVYLSIDILVTTLQEATPVSLRIQSSAGPVQAFHTRLPQADRKDEVRLGRRTTVWLDLLVHHVPIAVRSTRWGLRAACLDAWPQALGRHGLDSFVSRQSGGRRPQLIPQQTKRLVARRAAGPRGGGGATACGPSVRLRGRSWRECGVLDNRQDVCPLRHNVGVSLPQARCGAAHLDAAQRLPGLQARWPAMVRAAQRRGGLILCEDEARVAPWGALSSTGSRRGHPPAGPPSGQRKGSKGFGAIAYVSGRLGSQGREGRCNAEHDQACLPMRLAHTTEPLGVSQAGARDHTSASTAALLAAQRDRITAAPLPSYAPEDHPIAYLWKKTHQRATHHTYCKALVELTVSVEKALAYGATHSETVLGLFGRYCEESGLELKQAA